MTWGMVAMAGATIVGGVIASDSSRKASNALTDAAGTSNDTQLQMFNQLREDNQPLLESRNSALDQINALLKDPNAVTQQPDYKFGMEQGTRALNTGAAARGMTYGGAQGKALQRYGQDYAGSKLDASYNRLANIAGLGNVATSSNTAAGANAANQIGNNMTGAGNAQAGAALYTGSAYQNMLNNLAGQWGRYQGNTGGTNNNIWSPYFDGSEGGWTGGH
jgi:hypothetical protein